MRKILFNNNEISPRIKKKEDLKAFLDLIFAEENTKYETVSYVFCTDDFLLRLNQNYLNHDTLTDILTFVVSDKSLPAIAEIYISIERVRENSLHLKINYFEELLRVMIHGVLHICGYNDHTPNEKKIMRAKENYYIFKYGFT